MLFNVNAGNLVIANGGTTSNSIKVGAYNALTLYAPAALTGTVNIQASDDDSTFYDIKSGGSSVTIAANDALPLGTIGSKFMRLKSSGAEGAARTFKCTGQELK